MGQLPKAKRPRVKYNFDSGPLEFEGTKGQLDTFMEELCQRECGTLGKAGRFAIQGAGSFTACHRFSEFPSAMRQRRQCAFRYELRCPWSVEVIKLKDDLYRVYSSTTVSHVPHVSESGSPGAGQVCFRVLECHRAEIVYVLFPALQMLHCAVCTQLCSYPFFSFATLALRLSSERYVAERSPPRGQKVYVKER